MPAVLVTIEKSYAGQKWQNTHCVGIGPTYSDAPNDAFLSTIGCGSALSAAATASGAGTNFLQRLLSWERLMMYAAETISRVYVTDGKRNRLGGTEYFTAAPNLAGIAANPADQAVIVPGSIALQLNRNPNTFSQRPGRLFIRGLLVDTDVIFGGPKLVTWTNPATAANYATSIAGTLTGSGLPTHFVGGANIANGIYCIPKYRRTRPTPPKPNQEGELINAVPVASISVGVPTTRQAVRGRRRSA